MPRTYVMAIGLWQRGHFCWSLMAGMASGAAGQYR
jgi:hypothetical protein